MNTKSLYLLSFICFLSSVVFAQDEDVLKKTTIQEAEKHFNAGDYEDALEDYLSLHASDMKNDKYNYNIAVCYLNINGNKAKAIPYLELISHHDKHDPNVEYLLGRAYHYANRFDEAILSFKKFKSNGKGKPENLKDVDQQIQYCLNAKELIKFPDDVRFESLGSNINSEFSEKYAYVTEDESIIYFNTDRPEKNAEKMEDGHYLNSIYQSEVMDGEFQKAYLCGEPISKGNSGTEIIGLSGNGKVMLLYVKSLKSGDIYICEKGEDGKFMKPTLLDKNINSTNDEIAASINSDGTQLYFASNRPGGLGGTDLYMSKKQPNGKWSLPVNLGPTINTNQNEDFPNISYDGKTLYFSSTGHTSMGGYDIFKARFNEEEQKWENAQNMGFPINSTLDDMNFRISKNERYGYLSAIRPEGKGEYDIYRVIFNRIEPELSVLRGNVISEDGTSINYPDVLIYVHKASNKELVGTYLPNSSTGKYVIILSPGKYVIDVELFGFKIAEQTVDILDKASFHSEIDMDLKLQVQK